ncbi:unnamed protein product [Protopolystoma xenopodis]|uniref:Uncharacterized protein n=1 Tax=Protopolystoma xenopodis TaxID=117903 RepID=A0A3S5CLV2_9PLAT|nr:unnamed protein product [Protopolystoma xenopodis]
MLEDFLYGAILILRASIDKTSRAEEAAAVAGAVSRGLQQHHHRVTGAPSAMTNGGEAQHIAGRSREGELIGFPTNLQATAGESQFQEAVINTIAEFAKNLPDTQKIEILKFILNFDPMVKYNARCSKIYTI